jgi:3',5'-cyclic AMP phosphodiesterase CpdA
LFRLAHLSDPHLPSAGGLGPLAELASKRTLSRLAWRRKRVQHDPAVLAAIVADLKAQAPDHVAITGDLTNFATAQEFAAANAWLQALGPARDVTVSPGNHDALVSDGEAARTAALGPWFGDEPGGFPQVRRCGPVALVNLCSAIATPPLFASGRLGEAQLARLSQALGELGRAGLVRIVLVHHPVVDGVVSRRKALADAPALREVLKRQGAELVLHGHAHEAVFGSVGAIPVLGVPSASSPAGSGHPAARWHMIEIEGGAMQVIARGTDAAGAVGELGRYVLPALSAGIAA